MKKIMKVLLVLTIAIFIFNVFVFRGETISWGTLIFGYIMPLVVLSLYVCANAPMDEEEEL